MTTQKYDPIYLFQVNNLSEQPDCEETTDKGGNTTGTRGDNSTVDDINLDILQELESDMQTSDRYKQKQPSGDAVLVLFQLSYHRLLDSLVVECWLRVWEVPGSIPCKGPRHTKDVIKMVPVVSLFSTQHQKGNTGSFSRIKIRK